ELMEASHGTRSGAVAPGSADPGTPADVDPWVAALTQPADRKPRRKRTMRFHALKVGGAIAGLGLLTAACGERPVDRALTGGAIGAASGAVVGSTVGSPVAGAGGGGAGGAPVGRRGRARWSAARRAPRSVR